MPTIPAPGETAASKIGDAEHELALFQSGLDAVDEAVLVTSPELDRRAGDQIRQPAVARMTGYAPEELLGKTPRILQGPKTDRALLDRLRVDLSTSGRFEGEGANYRKDGASMLSSG